MGKQKAPAAPDPKETASAQTGTNVATALANAQLGNVNQYGPDGSVTYSTNGYQTITDPTSKATYNIPQYTQTTSLSPQQQAIKAQTDAASLNLGKTANQQSAFLQDYLGKPVDLSSGNVHNYINDHYSDDFNKSQDRLQSSLDSKLANQGITIGSSAYTNANNDFASQRASAQDNLYGDQYNNAVSQILAQRNQPLNEISALMGGSQVQTPTFGAGTNQPSLPTVDYAGLVNQNYQNQVAAVNANNQQVGSTIGGLFGLAGAFAGNPAIKFSDKRLKKNIKPVGKLKGHKLYEYNMKGDAPGAPKQTGVMAQAVQKKRPDAVVEHSSGYKAVDYGKLFKAGGK